MQLMTRLADGRETHDLTGIFSHQTDNPFMTGSHYTPRASAAVAQAIESVLLKTQALQSKE